MGAGDLLFYFKQFQSFHLGHSLNLLQLVRRIRPPNVVLRRTIIADVINLLYPGKTVKRSPVTHVIHLRRKVLSTASGNTLGNASLIAIGSSTLPASSMALT